MNKLSGENKHDRFVSVLAKLNALKWIHSSVHVYCDQQMNTWDFACTTLEQLGHASLILNTRSSGAYIKD